MPISRLFLQCMRSARLMFLPVVLMAPFPSLQRVVHAQDHSMHDMRAGMTMPMGDSADPALKAKLLADKRESEFNHHLAGFFVLLAGVLLLAEESIRERWPLVRLVWPVCFLLSGLFVLVWSDTELWPFGPQSWYYGLTNHLEVLQHKTFAILLLALGAIEIQRTRGMLKAAWSSWAFPVLAVIGSAMLFFHDHRAGMQGPNPMELMHRIQSEHFSFAMAGFGIGLSKGLAETRLPWKPFFERLFPALLMVLGALLMVYIE
jgi:copper resistance protein D